MDHPKKADPIGHEHVEKTMLNIDDHLRTLLRVYPDCETNSIVVGNLLTSAAIIRAKHMISHEKPGVAPTSQECEENLETLIGIVTEAFTQAIPLAVKHGADKPMNGAELLAKIMELINSIKSDNAALDKDFGLNLNRKDMH